MPQDQQNFLGAHLTGESVSNEKKGNFTESTHGKHGAIELVGAPKIVGEIDREVREIQPLRQGIKHHIDNEQQNGAALEHGACRETAAPILHAVMPLNRRQKKNQQNVDRTEYGIGKERELRALAGNARDLPYQKHHQAIAQGTHGTDRSIILVGRFGILHAHGCIQGWLRPAEAVVDGIYHQHKNEGIIHQNQRIKYGGNQDQTLQQAIFAF